MDVDTRHLHVMLCPWCDETPFVEPYGPHYWVMCKNKRCPVGPEMRTTYKTAKRAVEMWGRIIPEGAPAKKPKKEKKS